MKISHVVENLERGGLERMVIDLALAQRAAGHEVRVACLFQRGALAGELEAQGIAVAACGKRTGLDLRALARLRRWLRAGRGGVLHTHNATAHYHAVLAACGLRFARVLNTRHGMGLPASRGVRLYRWSLVRTDVVATVCQAARATAVANGLRPAGGVVAMPNGIRVAAFAPASADAHRALAALLGFAPGARMAGIVGRLNAVKDHAGLLQAFARVSAVLPDAALVVVGDGPLRAELEALAARLGIAPRVRFLGDRSDVHRLLPGLDAFVLSSRSEGYSMALLEASAAGLPIVATDVGGNGEIVAHGRTGLLVPAGDPAALAGALQAVLADPAAARAMGQAGREWALREATLEAMAARYERLYRDGAAHAA